MRSAYCIIQSLVLFGALCTPLPAQLRVGDPITLEVNLPACDSIEVLESSEIPMRVLPLDLARTQLQTGGIFRFDVAIYDTGSYVIPAVAIVPFKVGQPLDTVWSSGQSIEIASSLDDTTATPRPIKPYAEHPLRFADIVREYWPWLTGALLLAAIVFAWRKWIRRVKPGAVVVETPQLPPAELAVRELITLRDRRYPERGLLKEHFSEFSDIMRRYIEGRYGFPALEMTTYELGAEFKRSELPAIWRTDLLPVLHEADLVKFAKEIPSLDSCAAILDLGFKLVEQTKPALLQEETKAA